MFKILLNIANNCILRHKETLIMNHLTKLKHISYRFYATNVLTCWKCNFANKSPSIFCGKCNIIQKPVSTTNYFQILGLDEDYKVNLKEISQKYRKMQSFLHPDKYSNKYAIICGSLYWQIYRYNDLQNEGRTGYIRTLFFYCK